MKARTKTKSSVQETTSIFRNMETSDMTAIDKKIHDLLIAEGYLYSCAGTFGGTKLNNYSKVNRIEYTRGRGERERVIITSTHRPEPKNNIAGMLWEPVAPEVLGA